MTEPKTYTCEACHGVFEYEEGWTDEDAKAEMDSKFGEVVAADQATICDDCWKRLFPSPAQADLIDVLHGDSALSRFMRFIERDTARRQEAWLTEFILTGDVNLATARAESLIPHPFTDEAMP